MNAIKLTLGMLLAASSLACVAAGHTETTRDQRMDDALQRYRASNPESGEHMSAHDSAAAPKSGIKRGVHRTENAIERGVQTGGNAVKHGLEKVGEAAHHVGDKISEKVTPDKKP